MKIRQLWIIIILMSLAMLGSIVTQIYWINGAIKENEKKFKSQVYNALTRVAERLDKEEQKDLQSIHQTLESLKERPYLSDRILGDNTALSVEKLQNSRLFKSDLDDRIQPQKLANYLENELSNRGIDLEYQHVIYDRKLRAIIIRDGIYAVPDDNPLVSSAEINELSRSKYQVNLFTTTYGPAGTLIVTFPNEASLHWKGIWKIVAVSVLFTSLILFCFFYSIYIIYRQKKLSEMKTDFINNMTHEFKTPIATISLAADSIKNPKIIDNSDRVSRFANIIKEENKRMLSQVEKVLQMALLDKEDFQIKRLAIDLHEVITSAIEHANLVVIPREGLVIANLKAKDPIIEADITHISNIIHNLLDNANKYSPDKPEISVTTEDSQEEVKIIIQDRGLGLSKEAQKLIFDKFYRVHTGNRHDVKGFGLGLSYVKAMVAAHNGSVEVKSELGVGSSFILTFPRYFNEKNK